MELPGDPEALDRLADRIAHDADRIRAQAAVLRSRSAALRWRSTGAAEFRARIGRETAAMDGSAHELDEAVAVLLAHARTVRERLAFLRAVAARAQHELLRPGNLVNDARRTFDGFSPW